MPNDEEYRFQQFTTVTIDQQEARLLEVIAREADDKFVGETNRSAKVLWGMMNEIGVAQRAASLSGDKILNAVCELAFYGAGKLCEIVETEEEE